MDEQTGLKRHRCPVQGARGHAWKLDEFGYINEFGMESGYHQGPVCVHCGYSYCVHCDSGPTEDCPGAPADACKAVKP